MAKGIAVFGASSDAIDPVYLQAAHDFGRLIAKSDRPMVFGGGACGVMGAAARGAKAEGGCVYGVIPVLLNRPGVAFEACDALAISDDLRDRMQKMDELSSGFAILPGGFGTMYELFEVMTLNQLGYVKKPIVLLNTNGYYDHMGAMFDRMFAGHFAPQGNRSLYAIVSTPQEAIDVLAERMV